MAAETFKYPATGTPDVTLTFATAGRLLSEFQKSIKPNQISDVTMGGVRLTYNLGDPFTQYRYTFIVPVSSGATDLTDVESFIGSSNINFAENAFLWTDNDGNAKTVHMVNEFSYTQVGPSFIKSTWILEEQNT